jgi:hypothetical protein
MKTTVDERMRPVVVARSDIRHRSDRHLPNHGFFNASSASLPEVPLRNWGRMSIPPREVPAIRPEQKR